MSVHVRSGTKGGVVDFLGRLTAFADAIEATGEEVARQIMLALYRGIKERTPVDTGYARAQWQIHLVGDTLYARPVGDHAGEDIAALSRFDLKIHDTLILSNVAAYIKRLEYEGHSKQAPDGMVRVTMAEVEGRMKEIMAAAARANGLDAR